MVQKFFSFQVAISILVLASALWNEIKLLIEGFYLVWCQCSFSWIMLYGWQDGIYPGLVHASVLYFPFVECFC